MKIKGLIFTSLLLALLSLCVLAEAKVTLYSADGRNISVNAAEVELYKADGWSEAVTMYSLDGRMVQISPFAIEEWKAQGWYLEPVTKMYAPDGKTVIIAKTAVEEYEKNNWFHEPVTLMWLPDGTSKYVGNSQLEKYKNDGWYFEQVTLMWLPDGTNKYVENSQLEKYKNDGWYPVPVTLMWLPDGTSKCVENSQLEKYKNDGWYLEPVTLMWLPDGTSKYVEKSKVEDTKKAGWYLEPVTLMWAYDGRSKYVVESQVEANKSVGWYDDKADVMENLYAPDGRTKAVFKSGVALEKSVGWMDRTAFEKYLQPWVDAYEQTVLLGHFGGNAKGRYILAFDPKNGFDAIDGVDGVYSTYLNDKYGAGYQIVGNAQTALQKTWYADMNGVYYYLSAWFSKELFPHEGNYGLYKYGNNLYCYETGSQFLVSSGMYLGNDGNHHYMGAFSCFDDKLFFDVIELAPVNKKLVITKIYTYGSQYFSGNFNKLGKRTFDKDFVLDALEKYFTNKNFDYLGMSDDERTALAFYLIEKSYSDDKRPSDDYHIGNYKYTVEHAMHSAQVSIIRKGNNDTYNLQVKTLGNLENVYTYFDIRFTHNNGKPEVTEIKSFIGNK